MSLTHNIVTVTMDRHVMSPHVASSHLASRTMLHTHHNIITVTSHHVTSRHDATLIMSAHAPQLMVTTSHQVITSSVPNGVLVFSLGGMPSRST